MTVRAERRGLGPPRPGERLGTHVQTTQRQCPFMEMNIHCAILLRDTGNNTTIATNLDKKSKSIFAVNETIPYSSTNFAAALDLNRMLHLKGVGRLKRCCQPPPWYQNICIPKLGIIAIIDDWINGLSIRAEGLRDIECRDHGDQ